MALSLILIATLLAGLSGLAGLALPRDSVWGPRIAALFMAIAALMGLSGVALGLSTTTEQRFLLPWPLMSGDLKVAVDPLSAFFLAPIFLIGGLGAGYGLGYWRQVDHPDTVRSLAFFWGTSVAGMALLVIARHAMVFLVGWELMALSAFLLIATEDHLLATRQAAWLYLAATHVGTLSLYAMFSLMRQATGSWDLGPIGVDQAGLGMLTAIFLLALVAFGLKAGLMPLHFWLPSAHANAPSHVSAIFSGVMIKMGIYGLVRITGYLPEPPLVWGGILLILGAVSGVLGVVYALAQHDLKRLLAYHSVENIGIIVMGLGLAMAGRSLHRPDWVMLGMAGCLLHVWNHGLFKALLFLSAGSVVHATGTREIDRLGGLARQMPWTAGLFLVGAVAICGLPPLNGFVSELLIYMGLFRTLAADGGQAWIGASVGAPALALIGALAVACFVKVYGSVFLGNSRSAATAEAHEAPASMLGPMGVLAAACAMIGLAPVLIASALDNAVAGWTGIAEGRGLAPVASLAPLVGLSAMGMALLVLTVAGLFLVKHLIRAEGRAEGVTWGCGYARPTSRMQYSSSSFAQLLVQLFRWVLRPHSDRPQILQPFCTPARFESHVDDAVLDGQILPAMTRMARWLQSLHRFQQGLSQQYVLYILVAVVALLVWTLPIEQLVVRLFAR